MTDILVVVALLVITGSAVAYIIKEKKKGTKCIGCPYDGDCGRKKECNSNSEK